MKRVFHIVRTKKCNMIVKGGKYYFKKVDKLSTIYTILDKYLKKILFSLQKKDCR